LLIQLVDERLMVSVNVCQLLRRWLESDGGEGAASAGIIVEKELENFGFAFGTFSGYPS